MQKTDNIKKADNLSEKRTGFFKVTRLVIELVLIAAVVALAVWGIGLRNDNIALTKENTALNEIYKSQV